MSVCELSRCSNIEAGIKAAHTVCAHVCDMQLVHCLQVPVRQVKSGQHATVALHPCHLPLQPSPATQQFSQPHQSSSTAPISNSPGSILNGSILNGSSIVDQQASLQGLVHEQQEMQLHWQQQESVPQQLQGTGSSSAEAAASSAASSASSATSAPAPGLVNREQQGGAVAQQALPAGLMSQALHRQSQTAQHAPWLQQQDPYVLDHRIHREAEKGRHGQQQQQAVTAVGHYGHSLPSAAPVTVPSMSKHPTTHSDCNPVSASQSFAGAVSSSPALAGPAPPNARKGMVLLDPSMHSRTVWEFQAVVVLLNGHWPPRGLLSGCWPPKPNTPDTVLSTSLPDSPLGESACIYVGLFILLLPAILEHCSSTGSGCIRAVMLWMSIVVY